MLHGSVSDPWPASEVYETLVPASAYTQLQTWAGGGEPFANHDCVGLASPILDWDGLRRGLSTQCGHTRETRTLHCAAYIPDWDLRTLPFLRLGQQQPGLSDDDLAFEAFDSIEAAARLQCSLGVLILNIARTMLCARARDVACYMRHTVRVSRQLYQTPLTVVMGTQWPVFALLNSYDWAWPGVPAHRDYECERGNHTVVDWRALRRTFRADPARPSATWWKDSLNFVFDKSVVIDFYTASRECLYGVYVMNLIKGMWASDTESSSYRVYAPYVQWIFYESLHLLGAGGWQLYALLHHFQSLRRHGFGLDFTAWELGGLPFRERGEWLQSLPLEQHLKLLAPQGQGSWRVHFVATVKALSAALRSVSSEGLRFVCVTMVYGRFNKYIAGWAQRVRTLGIGNLVMAALDQEALDLCTQHHGEQCVTGSVSVLNKYTILLLALQLGIDVMWLDFDIFLVRNPGHLVEAAATGYDVLMGYDYDSDCLCNGFFYLRARPITHRWLFALVQWLYDHPYEHDQRAISAFLNYTEKVAADPEELPLVPKWHVFDVDNTFINWGSWEGDFDQLALVHFVDGSAFSLYGRGESWDPSIPAAKRRSSSAPEDEKMPATALDAFYTSKAAAMPVEGFWDRLPELRAMVERQKRPKPWLKQPCGILPSVDSAFKGYGWLVPEDRIA